MTRSPRSPATRGTLATSLSADTLHLKVVYAGRPHARIVQIDPSAALAAPGVVAVLTAADVPYNAFGLIDHDQPVLCADRVRFAGDKVAVVVAETQRRGRGRRAARRRHL